MICDLVSRPVPELPADRFPLLITGVAGVIGFNAFQAFKSRYPAPGQVIGVRQGVRGPSVDREEGLVFCDVENRTQLGTLFARYRFRSVIHTGGTCALKSCQLNPDLGWRINLDSMSSVLRQCEKHGTRLIALSVDLVYKGKPVHNASLQYFPNGALPEDFPLYTEDEPSDAISVYGQTMSAAEQLILLYYPETCILRISLPMGVSGTGHAGGIDWIGSRFRARRVATLFIDEFRTPTYCGDLNRVFAEVLSRPRGAISGLFHCGQRRPVTLYQVAQIINRVGGFDPNLLYGLNTDEGAPIPPRATNVAMNSQKLVDALGYDPFTLWPADESVYPTDPEWHRSRPKGFPYGWKSVERFLI